ncbi:hypothetical protein GCM10022268_32410 [Sphingomonas cynarae]|uniref:Endonuclease n=1 Tax=Sphingomonas cynarae TaxID=930197 RepID=A0ABP7ENZ1_9SPHN
MKPPRRTVAIITATMTLVANQSAFATTSCPTHSAGGVEPTLSNQKLARATTELCNRRFAVLHSAVTRTPLYVAEHLTRASIAAARSYDLRDNRFHADPRLRSSDQGELADYVRSGFDRGHMAPSGDMTEASRVSRRQFGLGHAAISSSLCAA